MCLKIPDNWSSEELDERPWRRVINDHFICMRIYPRGHRNNLDGRPWPMIYMTTQPIFIIAEFGYSRLGDHATFPSKFIAGPFESFEAAYMAYRLQFSEIDPSKGAQ